MGVYVYLDCVSVTRVVSPLPFFAIYGHFYETMVTVVKRLTQIFCYKQLLSKRPQQARIYILDVNDHSLLRVVVIVIAVVIIFVFWG